MIRRNTVFILGAGASKPYGYPLGQGLADKILSELKNLGGHEDQLSNLAVGLYRAGKTVHEVRDFRDRLSKSGLFSIDAFLENHPEHAELGKLAIAYWLLAVERSQDLFLDGDGRWYRYIHNQIVSGSTGRLSIINFNYDRSLERYLTEALKNTYRSDSPNRYPHEIEYIHVHGSIGHRNFPEDPMNPALDAARGIKIISDAALGPEYSDAHEILQEAEVVVFLGFGYHPDNVTRLDVRQFYDKDHLYGSTYGLGDDEVRRVSSLFGDNVNLAPTNWDALECLRNLPVLD